ncbi:MAG: hypothetical protein OXB88_04665 [Bacteriovoracales bacterium]|nr:hypothetical protein [Bacteriovoracales bacterium]
MTFKSLFILSVLSLLACPAAFSICRMEGGIAISLRLSPQIDRAARKTPQVPVPFDAEDNTTVTLRLSPHSPPLTFSQGQYRDEGNGDSQMLANRAEKGHSYPTQFLSFSRDHEGGLISGFYASTDPRKYVDFKGVCGYEDLFGLGLH